MVGVHSASCEIFISSEKIKTQRQNIVSSTHVWRPN